MNHLLNVALLAQLRFPVNIPDATSAVMSTNSLLLWSFKILFSFLSLFYVLFAVLVMRQVKIMNETVVTALGPVIQLLAWIHLGWAIFLAVGIFIFL